MYYKLDKTKISRVVDEGNTLKFMHATEDGQEMSFLMCKYIKGFDACYRVKINGILMIDNEKIDQDTIAFWVDMQNQALQSKNNYQELCAKHLVEKMKSMGMMD